MCKCIIYLISLNGRFKFRDSCQENLSFAFQYAKDAE